MIEHAGLELFEVKEIAYRAGISKAAVKERAKKLKLDAVMLPSITTQDLIPFYTQSQANAIVHMYTDTLHGSESKMKWRLAVKVKDKFLVKKIGIDTATAMELKDFLEILGIENEVKII